MGDKESLENEIRSIYQILHEREKGTVSPLFEINQASHPQTKRIAVRYIIAPFLLAIIIGFGSWLYEPDESLKLIILVLILIGYVGIVFVQFLEIYAERGFLKQIIRNPLALYTQSLIEKSACDVDFLIAIQSFSTHALRVAKVRLEVDQKAIMHRLGVIVGSLDKVGIIPGMFSLYLAAWSSSHQSFSVTAAVVIFFFFVMALAVHHTLPRLALYSGFIETELNRREGQ